ncbi:MAG TPA: hypothetical protein VD962_10685 [Rubricoccaceae bacterium]|nr:hypothetical protein [Rubricoccaceae bacterium]
MRVALPLLVLVVFASGASPSAPADAPINAVLGDASFVATFGRAPSAADGEELRIRTHLAHVEWLLRARDVSGLSPEVRAERTRLLDALAAYREAGAFPRNTTQPGRTPVFIDEAGQICAVGYLIEQSDGRDAAERIAAAHRYDRIAEMPEALLRSWAGTHGFTLTELAMIQPEYQGCYEGHEASCDDERVQFAVEAGTMVGAFGTGMLALVQTARGHRSPLAAGLAIGAGATAVGVGLTGDTRTTTALIVTGGAAVVSGVWNLLIPRPEQGPEVAPTVMASATGHAVPALRLRLAY